MRCFNFVLFLFSFDTDAFCDLSCRFTLKCSVVAQVFARRAAILIALVIQRQVYHNFTFGIDINTCVIEITIGNTMWYWHLYVEWAVVFISFFIFDNNLLMFSGNAVAKPASILSSGGYWLKLFHSPGRTKRIICAKAGKKGGKALKWLSHPFQFWEKSGQINE